VSSYVFQPPPLRSAVDSQVSSYSATDVFLALSLSPPAQRASEFPFLLPLVQVEICRNRPPSVLFPPLNCHLAFGYSSLRLASLRFLTPRPRRTFSLYLVTPCRSSPPPFIFFLVRLIWLSVPQTSRVSFFFPSCFFPCEKEVGFS